MKARAGLSLAALLPLLAGCGGDGGPVGTESATFRVTFSALRPLDARLEGSYEAWALDASGASHSLGRFSPSTAGSVDFASPIPDASAFRVTVEPPGDADAAPSPHVLLTGTIRGRSADLRIAGAVTQADLPLRDNPGQYTVFTPSDNLHAGYPSNEFSGIWLFNPRPRTTQQGDHWLRLTPVAEGWIYEGWAVRDFGSPDAIWLSYGKFLPDQSGVVNSRDDNGWGPFSGVPDYLTAGIEDFPGDDWISNPLGYPWPEELPLPLDLREKNPDGSNRWTHVLTIEPRFDRWEEIGAERPFLIQPYYDLYLDGRDGTERPVTLRTDRVPSARLEVR